MEIPFVAIPAQVIEEELFKKWKQDYKSPYEIAGLLSLAKAQSLKDEYPNHFVLGADTLVSVDEQILGKPVNENQAKEFLLCLSDREHSVITGFSWFSDYFNYEFTCVSITQVFVKKLSEGDIDRYIADNNVCDAAGGYKIQTFYPDFIREIKGSYFNVVGLPIHLVYESYLKLTEK